MTPKTTRFTLPHCARPAGLALALLFALPACTPMPPADPGPELRKAAAADPVPNWFHVPERQLAVGDRASYETSDGPARYEVAVTARAGDRSTVVLRWTAVPASHAYLKDLATSYVVDDRSVVRSARIEDLAAKRSDAAQVATPGGPAWVTQPTVMRLPVPEQAEVDGRKMRIDAVAVVESRDRGGMTTRVHYLSDDAKFGVVRIDSFPVAAVGVSDVVGHVAATRMSAGQADARPVPLSEALAARPGAAKARIVTRLVAE